MSATPTQERGHSAHTQDAAQRGLSGRIDRPIKLTMLGAGSAFTPRLANDILRIPGVGGGTIALVDIDAARLRTTKALVERLCAHLGRADWTVAASVDRKEVMGGSDYVVNCIEVSGTQCVEWDNDLPLKYGIDQCIGDTIGPGGLFKALRTLPVWIEVLRDCERLCPRALVLNYTNPMAMMCVAAARTSSMAVVGLCHSVQGTSALLASYAGVPIAEMTWECAGINHLAWFTRLEHGGRDLYPELRRKFTAEVAEGIREYDAATASAATAGRVTDLVRKDVCLNFGAFVTESSGHLSEYLPYYRKSEAGRKLLRPGYDGGSRFYASNWPEWRRQADRDRAAMVAGEKPIEWERSWEYASWIIEAREKDVPFRFHGNVMNALAGGGRLISNLPAAGCVEVACLADRAGVHPTRFGALPPQMAALSASNLGLFELGAQAAIDRDKEKAIHALMLDPLGSAICTPSQLRALALELFAAEAEFLPGYR